MIRRNKRTAYADFTNRIKNTEEIGVILNGYPQVPAGTRNKKTLKNGCTILFFVRNNQNLEENIIFY